MNQLSDKTVMVVDTGWYVEIAPRLAEEFGTVLYWSPWQGDFPYSENLAPGAGLEGVIRIKNLWEHIDDTDLFVFPADGFADIEMYLKSISKRVWGSGWMTDNFEHDRDTLKMFLVSQGLPIVPYSMVRGVEELYKTLHKEEDIYVKLVNGSRGDMETYHHITWELSRTWFSNLVSHLGPMAEFTVFMWERPTEGFEGGMDWVVVDGSYSSHALVGYEIKDSCYVSVVKPYRSISKKLTVSADAFQSVLANMGYRNFISTEVRITPEGVSYMIDLAARFPWPPCGTMMENIKNLPEVMWYGGEGLFVEPVFRYEYGVELNISAPSLATDWLAVEIEERHRKNFKLHGVCKVGNTYWLRPQHEPGQPGYVGTCIALADNFEFAKKACIKLTEEIKGQKLEVDTSDLEKAEKEIKRGEEAGINFWN